jgi:hypothetical protein
LTFDRTGIRIRDAFRVDRLAQSRCNVGPKYVCVDGPAFSLAELNGLPDEL